MPGTAHLVQFGRVAICYLRDVVPLAGAARRPVPELEPHIPT